jgi:hypothetical protein
MTTTQKIIFTPEAQQDATASASQNREQICDQCSRTLEEGALYEDHSHGIWDEKTKTYIRPSGTVKQGRRPMFKPHAHATDAHTPGNYGSGYPYNEHDKLTVALSETAAERDRLREQVKTLLAACKDIDLRVTQTVIASGIGKQKDRIGFLLGELERIKGVALDAIKNHAAYRASVESDGQ